MKRTSKVLLTAAGLAAPCLVAAAIPIAMRADARGRSSQPGSSGKSGFPAPSEQKLIDMASDGFPRGTWRLDHLPLGKIVVSGAHILIAFSGARPIDGGYPFEPRAQARSEAEAARIALRLAFQMSHNPADFEKAAKEFSDDSATSTRGGRLGVARADQVPPEFLDAFESLEVGQVGDVLVKTTLGYHVIRRDAIPDRTHLDGARILVAYDGADAAGRR